MAALLHLRDKQISLIILVCFGFFLFFYGTDGFTAFTAEKARTNKLLEKKPRLPEVTLEDSMGRKYGFEAISDKYIFMTFFYTGCTTVCPQLERNVAKVYEQIPENHLGEDIVFLSVSFDPKKDVPEVLKRYGSHFGSDEETWRLARVPKEGELKQLLDEFGVIAIPIGDGDFQHNVAFYLVDRKGFLIDVMDYNDIGGAVERVMEVLDRTKEG